MYYFCHNIHFNVQQITMICLQLIKLQNYLEGGIDYLVCYSVDQRLRGQDDRVIIVHNTKGLNTRWVLGVTSEIIDVNPKVVEDWSDLLNEDICALAVESIVGTIKGDMMGCSPTTTDT